MWQIGTTGLKLFISMCACFAFLWVIGYYLWDHRSLLGVRRQWTEVEDTGDLGYFSTQLRYAFRVSSCPIMWRPLLSDGVLLSFMTLWVTQCSEHMVTSLLLAQVADENFLEREIIFSVQKQQENQSLWITFLIMLKCIQTTIFDISSYLRIDSEDI